MATLTATEPMLCPNTIAEAESIVPACMFAPDRGCEDDPCGAEGFEGCDGTNGESADHLDLSSKLVLVSPTAKQYDLLLQHLRERIDEGCGETIYVIGTASDGGDSGLDDKDMEASIATVRSLCEQIDADLIWLRERTDTGGKIQDYLIRQRVGEQDFLEVRVAVVGNVDAGKSTLLGVLTHGELDNGRGFARQKLFRHKHEMESGRTSSVGNDILGFDQEGQVVNKPDNHGGGLDWTKICEKSSKVITFIDLAGHEKYLKTTVFGMTGHLPDFCMLMVGSNAGIVGMTKEHLGLALALNVPVFVVVTKIDMCPANILQETLKLLQRLLKSPGCRKIPVLVQNKDDVIVTASNFSSERMCPIFQISNVSGENMDLLKMFLNLLSPRTNFNNDEPAEFQIDDTYSVPGVGTVVSGTTLRGVIRLNDTLLLGPDPLGTFIPIPVKSIHRKRMPVKEVHGGQTASFALKKIKRSSIRKGMVMLSPKLMPQATWEFEAEILVLHHPTTISPRYQAMVHCGSIRQTATILGMNKDCLRTGDKATVHFRFIKTPEYLHCEHKLVFREGRTKAVGTVTKLLQAVNTQAAKAQQAKMLSSKKKDGAVSPEEAGSTLPSPNTAQLQLKSGSGGRRRGGQRHRGKGLNTTSMAPTVPTGAAGTA
ncbi:GTP-binding protein 1-like isoform X1 [Takifugu rubripes]|uniref:GTP-binding protein 1 n=1 Tax=Takifugu rubripes TaxID=31033 RepID=A0A3B5JWJ3_TAKRU|nr:GTP-binding protein 1-like isoform X1 [Takifugu rubripes]XP_011611051.1 GTP-binding protein 1-like isoform X1 [Takifugu rubripes]|eukprot:XP_003972329.1 PREDICTED: GTP-binding protein 1-like isoform X1 [Takifugu rubripes]